MTVGWTGRVASMALAVTVAFLMGGCGGPNQKPPAPGAVSGTANDGAAGAAGATPAGAVPGGASGVTPAAGAASNESPGEPISEADAKPTVLEAEAKATAAEYYELSKKDKNAWTKMFGNKVVELTGTVLGYESGLSGFGDDVGLWVKLVGDPENPFDVVKASIEQDWPWRDHPPGSVVTIVGRSSGFVTELQTAVIVGSEKGMELPALTVDELAKAEPQSLVREGLVKASRITGRFRRFDDDYATTGTIYLRGEEDADLAAVQFRDYEPRRAKHLKPGDKVVVLGEASKSADAPAQVEQALLVEPAPPQPEMPTKATRKNKYDLEFTHLIFRPEALNDWLVRDPRALLMLVRRHTVHKSLGSSMRISMRMIEVSGTVKAATTSDLDPADVYVTIEEVKDADLRFVFKEDDPPLAKLKPGTKATFRGMFNLSTSPEHAWIKEVSAVVK